MQKYGWIVSVFLNSEVVRKEKNSEVETECAVACKMKH